MSMAKSMNAKPGLRQACLCLVLALALSGLSATARGEQVLNTGTLVSGAVAALPSCLRFQVVGVCVWLACAGPVCQLKTSVKYGHRNPDVVVGVTNGLGKNPWAEADALYSALDAGAANALVSSMGGTMPGNLGGIEAGTAGAPGQNQGSGRKTNLSFREAQAVGHPLAGEIYCPSSASYLNAYYLSGLDAIGWRWQLPEVAYPQSTLPGLREIGHWPLNTWGAVYPRSGWLAQSEEPKAAAVAAQRVGDIITRSAQPHLYRALDSGGVFESGGKLVWRPEALEEGGDKTGDWQRMTPAMAAECEAFGADDTVSADGWSGGKLAAGGDYAWTLWRPYACCAVKGVFVGNIDVFPYP